MIVFSSLVSRPESKEGYMKNMIKAFESYC